MERSLEQIQTCILEVLAQAGLTACLRFPTTPAPQTPIVLLELGTAKGKPLGFCHYLGKQLRNGTEVELFGRRLELELLLEAFAPAAEAARQNLVQAVACLLSQLPEGLRVEEFAWEDTAFDSELQLFSRKGRLSLQACLLAQSEEESPALLHFQLRGEFQ